MLINAPRGTKDILPNQIYKWHYLEEKFKQICATYGFKEIRTPMFEYTELFKRGVGDTTDIVEKQMYSFNDYGGRNITLKPEGTASVVRAFVENKLYTEMQPSKYFYNISCFRYEKPQAGRLREFHQFGTEIFGTDSMLADAEVIAVAMDFFEVLGIKELELRINSIGCPSCREAYKKVLRDFLVDRYEDLCLTCKGRYDKNPMRILDCKSEVCQALVIGAPKMLDYICDECKEAFDALKVYLGAMGICYIVDSSIVRGLDYYTKTAFEIISKSIGAQGTVCGGGRYDNLIEQVGGPAIPGVGFGLGIERLLLVLETSNIDIPAESDTDVFVAAMGQNAQLFAAKLLRQLRYNGIHGQMDLLSRSFKNQFKYADKLGVKYTLMIGDDELSKGSAILKNMGTGEQTTVAMDEILSTLSTRITEGK